MKLRHLVLVGVLMLVGLASVLAASRHAGPGMTLIYGSAIKDTRVYIESERLPDGTEFFGPGSVGGTSRPDENPLVGEAEMSAAPDGRDLPEYMDFRWREQPFPRPPDPAPRDETSAAHEAWLASEVAELKALPIRSQRVMIRDRIPADSVRAAIEANLHTPRGELSEASIRIAFIWTDDGIKLRWAVWHRLPSGLQYESHQGGDEIVPAGKTMIAGYASTIKSDTHIVALVDGYPERYPATVRGTFFSGSPSLAYTDRPVSGGEKLVAFESEPELPEWIHLRWALFPTADIPPKAGESMAARHFRGNAIFGALPRHDERILVRSRIPQDVRDEIAAATRNAQPHKAPSSVIYLYFVWTDSGVKLHWRLKRSRPDGTFVSVREGGDEIRQAGGR